MRNGIFCCMIFSALFFMGGTANAQYYKYNLFVDGSDDLYELDGSTGKPEADLFPSTFNLNGGGGMFAEGDYLYIASWGDHCIKRYNFRTGERKEDFIVSGPSPNSYILSPQGLVRLNNGWFCFTSYTKKKKGLSPGGRILCYDPTRMTEPLELVNANSNGRLICPGGMAVNSHDVMYVISGGDNVVGNPSVKMFASNGGYAGEIGKDMIYPYNVYIAKDDTIYILGRDPANTRNSIVLIYNRDNTYRGVFLTAVDKTLGPGMTFGPNGDFYVINGMPANGSILEYSPSGEFVRILTKQAFGSIPGSLVFAPVCYAGDGEFDYNYMIPPLAYSGNWYYWISYGSVFARTPNDRVALRFTGNSIYCSYCGDRGSGTASWMVDNGAGGSGVLDFWLDTDTYMCTDVPLATGLGPGMHSVVLRPTGDSYVDFIGYMPLAD